MLMGSFSQLWPCFVFFPVVMHVYVCMCCVHATKHVYVCEPGVCVCEPGVCVCTCVHVCVCLVYFEDKANTRGKLGEKKTTRQLDGGMCIYWVLTNHNRGNFLASFHISIYIHHACCVLPITSSLV